MNITNVTEPPFEPVSLEDCYGQLRLDPDGSPLSHPDDDMLERYIATAREFVETAVRRTLVMRTLRLSVDAFPVASTTMLGVVTPTVPKQIRLIRPPVISVSSVKYFDGDNVLQTVSASDYYITDEEVPQLRFVTGFSAPTVYARPDAVRVEYVAGYAPSDASPLTQADYVENIPKSLRDAVLLGVDMAYNQSAGADRDALMNARESLMQSKRVQLTV